MKLGPNYLPWIESVKYLGVYFYVGSCLRVNNELIRHKFFAGCNSVIGHSRSLDELLQRQLHETYCLPVLQYALCAVKLTASQCCDLIAAGIMFLDVYSTFVSWTPFVCLFVVLDVSTSFICGLT